MFDLDSGKLLILGLIALIVIKPKDLPGVMRQIGQTIAQLRRMAAEFQGQFKDAMQEAELDELKKEMTKVTDLDGLDPFRSVKNDMDMARADIESALQTPDLSRLHTPEAIEPPVVPDAAPVAEHEAGQTRTGVSS
jgi:sec-independent protein translocase protein TatB